MPDRGGQPHSAKRSSRGSSSRSTRTTRQPAQSGKLRGDRRARQLLDARRTLVHRVLQLLVSAARSLFDAVARRELGLRLGSGTPPEQAGTGAYRRVKDGARRSPGHNVVSVDSGCVRTPGQHSRGPAGPTRTGLWARGPRRCRSARCTARWARRRRAGTTRTTRFVAAISVAVGLVEPAIAFVAFRSCGAGTG